MTKMRAAYKPDNKSGGGKCDESLIRNLWRKREEMNRDFAQGVAGL